MKVLFVCTGNTCRSAMCEGIFNHLSSGAFSRGLYAEGGAASENAIRAMEKMGIDISSHLSKQLTRDDVEEADLVLTMTKNHKTAILSVMPEAKEKVFTLGEYADGDDVSDPFGKNAEAYEQCAEQLRIYIERTIEKIK